MANRSQGRQIRDWCDIWQSCDEQLPRKYLCSMNGGCRDGARENQRAARMYVCVRERERENENWNGSYDQSNTS